MDLKQKVIELLEETGPGRLMMTAYETAWIARLAELGEPIGNQALEWLRAHQLPDGSWGAPEPLYYHDRVVCTLSAMNALARRGRALDRERLSRAESALEVAIKGLAKDPAGETVGFELIVPTLLFEAKKLGAFRSDKTDVLKELIPKRATKLSALPQGMINRHVTVAFSAEMAGLDNRHLLDVDNLQEADGSVGYNPSATAYFSLYVKRGDPAALAYLHRIVANGAAPNFAPFDVFERAWVLWNLSLVEGLCREAISLCSSHLDFLESAWKPNSGVGFAADYAPTDSDSTSVVHEVLTHYGRQVDVEAILNYEEDKHFRCFQIESNPSISANIHILSALRKAGFGPRHSSVQKILKFLLRIRTADGFWHDKWHSSPYYATSHAIIACIEYNSAMLQDAIDWILATQDKNGAWGYYMPTAEETAYCLQALTIWQQHGMQVPDEAIERGYIWLIENSTPPYPPLWIVKSLYCPEMIVRSAILSALMLVEQR